MTLAALLVIAFVAWLGLRGSLGFSTFVMLGLLATWILVRHGRDALRPLPALRVLRILLAAGHVAVLFGWELLLSNMQQLQVVLGPARLVQPHWLSFETELRSPALRALLGMMISLTPGTMTVDIEPDGTVWVHVLVAEDDGSVIRRLRDTLERPLRRLES